MAVESKRVIAILLAGGRSERFGKDKLSELFEGRPLAHHAARALFAIDFARVIAVVGPTAAVFTQFDFDVVRLQDGSPMSASIASGIREANTFDCDACLIALADMPLITTKHFRALMWAHESRMTATLSNGRNMAPALDVPSAPRAYG